MLRGVVRVKDSIILTIVLVRLRLILRASSRTAEANSLTPHPSRLPGQKRAALSFLTSSLLAGLLEERARAAGPRGRGTRDALKGICWRKGSKNTDL